LFHGTAGFEELIEIYAEQPRRSKRPGGLFRSRARCLRSRAAVIAIKSVSSKPIAVSFSCGSTGRTLFGGNLTAGLLSLSDLGIDAYGINCSGDLKLISSLLSDMKIYSDIPLIAKPNAGLPEIVGGEMVYNLMPEDLAAEVPAFVSSGARLIGGCCGTDERHIAAIKRAMELLHYPEIKAEKTNACASEFRVVDLSEDTAIEELPLTEDIMENAAVAEALGAEAFKITITDEEDIEVIEDNQYALRAPLCAECKDPELLKRFLRIYNGKPAII
jgi:5-methyltetrahydrofolate--homocysteine methyltransferase